MHVAWMLMFDRWSLTVRCFPCAAGSTVRRSRWDSVSIGCPSPSMACGHFPGPGHALAAFVLQAVLFCVKCSCQILR